MTLIRCDAKPRKVGAWMILELPKSASAKLPSRGINMIEGTLNGVHFQTPLEPDGNGSHWFKLDAAQRKAAGTTATLEFEPMKDWPETPIPVDVKTMLAKHPKARATWDATTTTARWDWIRWIRATKNPDTRKKHIDVACSKLTSGMKRPCCFNRSMCTEPSVSHNGALLQG